MNKTEKLIGSVDFSGRPDIDMLTSEYYQIRNMNLRRLGRLDICDLMYDAYKLGFAKGRKESNK